MFGTLSATLENLSPSSRLVVSVKTEVGDEVLTWQRTMTLADLRQGLAGSCLGRKGRDWTPDEVGQLFAVGGDTIRRWLNRDPELVEVSGAYRFGSPGKDGDKEIRPWRFPEASLEALVAHIRTVGMLAESPGSGTTPAKVHKPAAVRQATPDQLGNWRKARHG